MTYNYERAINGPVCDCCKGWSSNVNRQKGGQDQTVPLNVSSEEKKAGFIYVICSYSKKQMKLHMYESEADQVLSVAKSPPGLSSELSAEGNKMRQGPFPKSVCFCSELPHLLKMGR